MKWDKNDWQGKTKEEIEYSYRAVFFGIVLSVVLLISILITKLN